MQECKRGSAASRTNRVQGVKVAGVNVTMMNYCNGGFGISFTKGCIKKMNLAVGRTVVAEFKLCGADVRALLIVKNMDLKERRAGLQYADGKQLNPQGRVTACQNTPV